MFCPECFIEHEENEKHITRCPICGTLLLSSAFEEPVFDDDEIDYDDLDDDSDPKHR